MTTEQPTQEMVEEKAKRRTTDALFWGGAFIIAGLVFLADNLDVLPQIGTTDEWWFWMFLGAGVWALLINIYRLVSADWPNPNTGDYIWTAVFLFIGIGGAYDFDIEGTAIAAIVLVAIGVVILAGVFRRRE
jgi:hypothetical protein